MEISLASFKARFTYDPQKDLLGKGGYSEVYKAYDNDYKTDVALKIYQGDYSSQYNLLNEIRKYRRLQHAHVIQHLEAFEVNTGSQDLHGNTIKYQVGILEYANAGTLADLIKQGQLTGSANAAKLESIAKDIISGLEYLHSQNIIHRDLKPSNILLFKEGEKLVPKICDFGIAKVMDNATAVSTQLVGTVEYMAPEYFRTDIGDIGKASDLWSLGVILLEAASGQHPFGKASEGYSNGQIINNILSKEKINLDVIQDASILEIVRGLLNPNPQYRQYKNVGTEVKYTSEPIKNHTNSNSKPIAVSNNKFWNLVKHVFFIDFKEPNRKKLIAREVLILLITIFLPLVIVLLLDEYNDSDTPLSLTMFPLTRIILSIIIWSLEVLGFHFKINAKYPAWFKKTFTLKRLLWSFLLLSIGTSIFYAPQIRAYYYRHFEQPIIEWASIPAGTFTMGSPSNEPTRENDETQHEVTLSAFKMSKYEVTFEQYDAFCEATKREKPDDNGWGRGKRPVINVSWDDAAAFASWMGCRLPTEAEWEYACRAGTTTPYNTGDKLSETQANYDGSKTMIVGTYTPNAWGLYDMHGNVEEWCSDWYDWYGDYKAGVQVNPKGPSIGKTYRIIRGGSFTSEAYKCRSALRLCCQQSEHFYSWGFRLVSPE
jgi:serine/threonine protein kinase